jgi:hypothetical protein
MTGTSSTVVTAMRATVPRYLRWYHRHEIHIDAEIPEPALIVGNHGFGGLADLNVLAMFAVREKGAFTRPITASGAAPSEVNCTYC